MHRYQAVGKEGVLEASRNFDPYTYNSDHTKVLIERFSISYLGFHRH